MTSTYTSLPFGDGFGDGYGNGGDGIDGSDPNYFAQLDNDSLLTVHAQYREYYLNWGRWMSPDPYDGSYRFTNPQSLNRYSYVLNNPLGRVDPSGQMIQNDGGCAFYDCSGGTMVGEGTGGTGYYLDGLGTSASTIQWLISMGGAVQCANNVCSGFSSSGEYGQYSAFVGGPQGYYDPMSLNDGINAADGQLFTNSQYQTYLQATYAEALASQYARLNGNLYAVFGDAASADPNDPNVIDGNANFSLDCPTCALGRYNFGIHVELDANGNLVVHDDSASPWTDSFSLQSLFTANFWEHAIVDYIYGKVCNCVLSRH